MRKDNEIKKFELSGSKAHYIPSLMFTVSHMQLFVEPDFKSKTINCKQQLRIVAIRDISEIILDICELEIKSVFSTPTARTSNNDKNAKKLDFRIYADKLTIKLDKVLIDGNSILVIVTYSAKPRKGFYFIEPDQYYPRKNLQAWTQGQTAESKYWFPCIDHPVIKFETEVSVIVPMNFVAISNGKLVMAEFQQKKLRKGNNKEKNGAKKIFTWIEPNPHTAYLTSVVIGNFVETREMYNDGIKLFYYVPTDKKTYVKRSFGHTADMIRFFEGYFSTKYPFSKYSQITVEDFTHGGMENSSCTTLTIDTLHDKKAHLDYTSDHLISHELAHQWFGDFVTCRDWQHIWLNEGFATYCEALYWEASKGIEEFQYYVIQMADEYFDEANNRYKRPVVTKIYKHPDDLFDRHTYEKSGCVLHMLRNQIGDKYFKRSLKTYLGKYANSVAETDDFRKILELESGISLQQFFDQWLFRSGHPEIKIEFSTDSKIVKLKIEQSQEGDAFEFSLDIKLVFFASDGSKEEDEEEEEIHTIDILEKESTFQIPIGKKGRGIEWFSIDPQFKVLKTMSVKAPKEMLIRQLEKGKTIIERIQSARILKEQSSEDVIKSLQKVVIEDSFWGVAAEAAKSLGSIKSDFAYTALRRCLASPSVVHPKVKRAIVRAIGEFKREDSLNLLKPILMYKDKSYFVEAEAATAIGKIKNRKLIPTLKKAIETTSFQDVVAQGAINGLKEFVDDREIATLLIKKSTYGNNYRVREAATFALGKFIHENQEVFNHLKNLLTDRWFRVRINACRAFADAEEQKAISELMQIAEHDLDHRVKRVAEECINIIRQSLKVPKELINIREEIDKLKSKNLDMMQRVTRVERELLR